jgi:hypothetical protein
MMNKGEAMTGKGTRFKTSGKAMKSPQKENALTGQDRMRASDVSFNPAG